MNVLFITYGPFARGGPGVWYRNLTTQLQERGHKLYALTWSSLTEPLSLPRTITTYCFPAYAFTPLGIPSTFLFSDIPKFGAISLIACKLIKSKGIDVIHTDSVHYGCSAALAKAVTGTPLVTTIHGYYPLEMAMYVKGITRAPTMNGLSSLERFTIDHTDAITVDMKWLKERLGERLRGKKCVYIPFGIPMPEMPQRVEVERRQTLRVLCPTRFQEQTKRISVAVEAAVRLSNSHRDVEISFIRWGPDIKLAVPLERYENIKFLDQLPHDRYLELLKSTDLVWGQFSYGDLGTSEIEAMVFGKPLITSMATGAKDPDPPPVLSAWEPGQVVDYTLDYLNDPGKYSDMLHKARSWAERHYSVKVIADKIERTYHEVMDNR